MSAENPDVVLTEMERKRKILAAAENMDWQQVVLNGGPPCFHLDEFGVRFCGRAERWAGHGHKDCHEFTPLDKLLKSMA